MATIADIMMNAMQQPRATQRLGAAYLQGEENRRKGRLADLQERMVGAQVDQLEYQNSPEERKRKAEEDFFKAQKMVLDYKKSASEAEINEKDLQSRTILSSPDKYKPQEVAGARLWMESGTSPDKSTIEIYDPNSPTGTRIVKRSDAIGQPGKMRSSTSLTVDPETGEVTFSQGSGLTNTPKGAETALFKDYVAGQQTLDSIRQIESLYEPEFLTYKGAGKGFIATELNKLDPEIRSQFQARRSAFISAANKEFLRFRKWATGVAGGEKEMAEIKRATFSEDDSPQDFESKLQLARSLQRRLNARAKAALASGVDNDAAFKKYIEANPLDQIPTLQERGDQLEAMGYKPDQVMNILIDEGYVTPGQK